MTTVAELVRKQMQEGLAEIRRSLDWYDYVVEPLAMKYRIPIDGDFKSRKWWFVLRSQ